jgi:hypothetical protein
MSNGTGEIIVRAGSAEVEFDPEIYKEETSVGKKKKYKNDKKKVTRVQITGDINIDRSDPNGLKCVITVSTEDK